MDYVHLFIVHASVLTAALIMIDVHKFGIPRTLWSIGDVVRSAGLLGCLMGILTAHAHGHYLNYIKEIV